MKHLPLILAVTLATGLFAQSVPASKVPKAVQSGLTAKFPKATVVKWDKEGNDFEASFSVENRSISILLNAKGEILETEEEIAANMVPAAALAYMQKNYPKTTIKEMAKITRQNGEVVYELEVKGKDLLFDTNGNFVKKN